MKRLTVLVACEFSGTVRDAFTALGHDAMSCDLLPTEKPGKHYLGSVLDLMEREWDLVIAHPPCTYLSNSGVRWLATQPGRWEKMREGAEFFRRMFDFKTPRLCVENPIQHKHAKAAHGMGGQSQIIQPWQFGHGETKATALWLRGLPPLVPTDIVEGRKARAHRMPPGKDRWKQRSLTLPGVGKAMAAQWGCLP